MAINYVWRKGKAVTKEEFTDLLTNHKSFYAKLSLITKGRRISDIVNNHYVPKRWFWAWCFTNVAISRYKWDSAYKHVYDSKDDKLYTDEFFPKRYMVSTGTAKDIIAFGASKEKYEIAHPTA